VEECDCLEFGSLGGDKRPGGPRVLVLVGFVFV
jgi:hypothetical protein